MRRRVVCWIVPAALALVPGCKDEEPPNLVRETIGADGGVIASHDGVLSLVILPGALSSNTEIEIFPSSEPPNVFGPAYRVRPDVELSVPAEVTYQRVLPRDPSDSAIGVIRLDDYGNEMGYWRPLATLVVDAEQESITGVDDQLSLYYALLEDASALPPVTGTTSGTDTGTTDSGPAVTATSGSTTDPTDPTNPTTDPTDPTTPATDSTTDPTTDPTTDSTTDPTMPGTDSSGGGMQMCGDGMPVAGELCLVTGANYGAGMGPTDLVLADFDGDLVLDVATSNAVGGDVAVMLGVGDGSFGAPALFPAGINPVAIAVGDFDGNGSRDVAVANLDDDTVGVLLGNGNGTFQAMVPIVVGDAPSDLVTAVYGAGAADDLAVVNSGDSTLQALTGAAGGAMGVSAPFMVQAGSARAIVSGEFNSDASNDAFVVGLAGNYHGWAGDGMGSFIADASGAFAGSLVAAVDADYDGNGNTDLVVVDAAAEQIQVWGGNGVAGFFFFVALDAGTAPSDVAVANLDAQGGQEVVAVNSGSDDVMVFANTGVAFPLALTLPVGASPSAVKVGDVTGDGVPDLVVANEGADTISVIVSDP